LAILFRGEIELQYLEKSPLFVEYYFWFIPLGVATAFYHYFEIYLRSFYKNVISVVAQDIVLRILVTVLLVLYWLKMISFYQLVIWHSLMHFIPPLILSLYLIKMGEFSLTIRHIDIPKKMKRIIFQYSSFNYVSVIGLVLLNSLDVIMLAQYVGLKSAGVFSTIMFLIGAILIPYRSIVRIASPMVADFWKQRNFEQMQNLYQKVSSVSLFIGLSFYWHEANWFPYRRLVTALLLIVYAAIVTKPGCYRYKNRGLPLQNRPSSVIKAANLTKNLFSRLKRLSDKEIQSLNLFIAQLLAL
jgi:O-antigen/teichoic acid export membrane protein